MQNFTVFKLLFAQNFYCQKEIFWFQLYCQLLKKDEKEGVGWAKNLSANFLEQELGQMNRERFSFVCRPDPKV